MLITDANYKEATNLLKERFGDEQAIISSHMKTLCKLEAVESCKDVKTDKTEAAVRSLKSLNIKLEMYGVFLTPLLMTKIPEELRIIFSRNSKGITWDLEEILKVFHQELQIREKYSDTTVPFGKQKNPNFHIRRTQINLQPWQLCLLAIKIQQKVKENIHCVCFVNILIMLESVLL